MKLLHLSDLHLGKKICEMSMIDEQQYIFDRIFEYVQSADLDAVIIAGDVYDKSIPPVEAVCLFDSILERFNAMSLPVFIISGNHDSPRRLSVGSAIMRKNGIYFGTDIEQSLSPVTLEDKYGKVNFYLLPFMRPADVNDLFGEEIRSFTEAVKYMTDKMNIDPGERNVIVSHQFVAGAALSESEMIVGNTECVDKSVYEIFDYAALGHIHSPQNVGSDTIRYCGTPLKYSASEAGRSKSLTVVTLEEKGSVRVDTVDLLPLHDMRKIKGKFNDLTREELRSDDYIYVELTDEMEIQSVAARLRAIYCNLMSVSYSYTNNLMDRENAAALINSEEKSTYDMFTEFYSRQHNDKQMSDIQKEILNDILERMEG